MLQEMGWTFLGIASMASLGLVMQFVRRAW